jgi:hypothetical protein
LVRKIRDLIWSLPPKTSNSLSLSLSFIYTLTYTFPWKLKHFFPEIISYNHWCKEREIINTGTLWSFASITSRATGLVDIDLTADVITSDSFTKSFAVSKQIFSVL